MSLRTLASKAGASTLPPRRRRRLRDFDWPLLFGLIAIAGLLLVALYGPIVAPHDPWDARVIFDGRVPPFEPSPVYPLGSDAIGRDRLSWLLYGARMTFTIALGATLIRLLIGIFFGVAAAWLGGRIDAFLSRIALAMGSIPAVVGALLGVIAFGMGGALSFVLGLAVVGWADAFQHTRRAARAEAARPYIDCARSVGASDWRIVIRHLLPNLAPVLATVAALQVSAVLLLMGELALIRVFFGGAISSGLALVPAQPEWASTLAGTRPIFDLYGNAVAILAPGGALLLAVISFNLFGDAVARRAQRLDIFHLFGRRQMIGLVLIAVALTTPALLWPSPLSAELAYANRFDVTQAIAVSTRLASSEFGGRVTQTSGADVAAGQIASLLQGELVELSGPVTQTRALSLALGGQTLTLGPGVVALSQTAASVRGRAVLVTSGTPFLFLRESDIFRGGVAFVRDLPPQIGTSGAVAQLTRFGAAAVVVISDEPGFLPEPVSVPTVRLSAAKTKELFGGTLPRWPSPDTIALPLDVEVKVDLEAVQSSLRGFDVMARIASGSQGGPLLMLIAPYDVASSISDEGIDSASAIAVLTGAAEVVRQNPIHADVVLVAAAAESLDNAGIKAALSALAPDERRRLAAIVLVQSATGSQTTIHAGAVTTSGGPSLAARVAEAAGAQIGSQPSPVLSRLLGAINVRVPIFELVASDPRRRQAGADGLSASGRSLLTLISYIAARPEKLL